MTAKSCIRCTDVVKVYEGHLTQLVKHSSVDDKLDTLPKDLI